MSISPLTQASPKAERRRLVAIGLLRASATAIILIAAYYLLPLDRLAGASLAVSLAIGLIALTGIAAYQVRAIIRHPHSAVRAIEADDGEILALRERHLHRAVISPQPD